MIPNIIIANYIQEKFGLFAVVSSDGAINALEKKPTAAIYFNRTPYFADPETEAINIRIEFDYNATTARDQAQFDDKMGLLFEAVNGVKKTVTHNAKTYKFRVYLQSYEPIGPRNDSGKIMNFYQITGIVIATSSGAISAVDIGVQLKHNSDSSLEPLILLKYNGDYTVNHELKVPVNGVEAIPVADFINRIYSVYFVADSTTASKRIEKTAIGVSANSLTDTYTLQITASDGTTASKTVKLLNATADCTVGGFMTLQATFRGA